VHATLAEEVECFEVVAVTVADRFLDGGYEARAAHDLELDVGGAAVVVGLGLVGVQQVQAVLLVRTLLLLLGVFRLHALDVGELHAAAEVALQSAHDPRPLLLSWLQHDVALKQLEVVLLPLERQQFQNERLAVGVQFLCNLSRGQRVILEQVVFGLSAAVGIPEFEVAEVLVAFTQTNQVPCCILSLRLHLEVRDIASHTHVVEHNGIFFGLYYHFSFCQNNHLFLLLQFVV